MQLSNISYLQVSNTQGRCVTIAGCNPYTGSGGNVLSVATTNCVHLVTMVTSTTSGTASTECLYPRARGIFNFVIILNCAS